MAIKTLIIACDLLSLDVAMSLIENCFVNTPQADTTALLVTNSDRILTPAVYERLKTHNLALNVLALAAPLPGSLLSLQDKTPEAPPKTFTSEEVKLPWFVKLGPKTKTANTFRKELQTYHNRYHLIRNYLKREKIERIIFTHELPGNDIFFFSLAARSLGIKSSLVPLKVPWVLGLAKHYIDYSKPPSSLKEYYIAKALYGRWVSPRIEGRFTLRLKASLAFYLRWWQPQPRQPFANGTLPYDEIWLRNDDKKHAWEPVLHAGSKPMAIGAPHDLAYGELLSDPEHRLAFRSKIANFDASKPTVCVFLPSNLNEIRQRFRALPFEQILEEYAGCVTHLSAQSLNLIVCPHPRLSDEALAAFNVDGVTFIRDAASTFLPFLDGAFVDASSSLVDEMESLKTPLLIWDVYDNGGPLMTQPYLEWDEKPSDQIAAFSKRVVDAGVSAEKNAALGTAFQDTLRRFLA